MTVIGHVDDKVEIFPCSRCRRPVFWAPSAKTPTKSVLLNAAQVPSDTPKAYVVLHGVAYSSTVRDLALATHERTLTTTPLADLPHHLHHSATSRECSSATQRSNR